MCVYRKRRKRFAICDVDWNFHRYHLKFVLTYLSNTTDLTSSEITKASHGAALWFQICGNHKYMISSIFIENNNRFTFGIAWTPYWKFKETFESIWKNFDTVLIS